MGTEHLLSAGWENSVPHLGNLLSAGLPHFPPFSFDHPSAAKQVAIILSPEIFLKALTSNMGLLSLEVKFYESSETEETANREHVLEVYLACLLSSFNQMFE